ncbi:unnamed protein product [Ilex paraguariensis]|uniref:Uncharacterized protein n=1 Tax=Ilex paraguariensis TaxID=185542 RepID=A0ABC8UFN4_9AQUA
MLSINVIGSLASKSILLIVISSASGIDSAEKQMVSLSDCVGFASGTLPLWYLEIYLCCKAKCGDCISLIEKVIARRSYVDQRNKGVWELQSLVNLIKALEISSAQLSGAAHNLQPLRLAIAGGSAVGDCCNSCSTLSAMLLHGLNLQPSVHC